ncbi:MAG: thermonuclease family protein [Deltaproteobacteria bacterium]|nr:thermonuclease family protein [Deltaproteobacteria bacterium]
MKRFLLVSIFLLLPSALPAQSAQKVVQVIDGGHLLLEGGETVALLGVEAPAFPQPKVDKDGKVKKPNSLLENWARLSKAFAEGMVLNREVWLEYDQDKQNTAGQTLAYVFFKLDAAQNLGGGGQKVLLAPGTYMLNRLILTYGFANAGSSYACKYRSEFNQLQNQAQQHQTGLFQSNY